MSVNAQRINEEIYLEEGQTLVSRTDLRGVITFVNKEFVEISGYSEAELMGSPHNMVRHPDMPSAAFEDLWSTVGQGKPWVGIVKNLTKSGGFYWVEARVIPVWKDGSIVEYMSVRRKPSREQIAEAESLYRDLRAGKEPALSTSEKFQKKLAKMSIKSKLSVLLGLAAISFVLVSAFSFKFFGASSEITNLVMVFAAFFVLLSSSFYFFLNRFVLANTLELLEYFKNIAGGRFDERINISKDDEIGQLMQMLHTVQTKLNFELEYTNNLAAKATTIKNALDVCDTNVMIADNSFNISYLNAAVHIMFKDAEFDLKKDLPDFSADDLIGKNIDVFHKKPMHQRHVLAEMTKPFNSRINVGGRTFDLIATPVKDEGGQRLGTVVEWADMTAELARLEQEKVVADANARLKQTLDSVSSNVMVADNDLNIIYMNEAANSLMSGVESDLKKDLSAFDAKNLIGQNIDIFHKNPAHQRGLLEKLSATHDAQFVVGGRTMAFVANPVFNETGERLGTAVEWSDRTSEVSIENEIEDLVQSAVDGDLSKRVSLGDKEGFFRVLAEGLNTLVETSEKVVMDTGAVLSSLSEGDLTSTINNDYGGTFGELKTNANKTVENLTKIITQVRAAANSVASGADEIARGNADLRQRTEEQASSLEETASSMEEMTSVVRQSSDNANNARELSDDALGKARAGGNVVKDAVVSMGDILSSSKKIAEIIGVIDEIAFQTNLLALNAAVEAARAGEQGRGFAVVASEVRSLSQRSANAAKEIKELIQDSVAQVENGVELVNKTGDTLGQIVDSVEQVNSSTNDISSAASEQTDGIEQINKAVGQMDEMTQQNAALVEQASAASENMAEQAKKMRELMGFFTMMGGAEAFSPPVVSAAINHSGSSQSEVKDDGYGGGEDWEEF